MKFSLPPNSFLKRNVAAAQKPLDNQGFVLTSFASVFHPFGIRRCGYAPPSRGALRACRCVARQVSHTAGTRHSSLFRALACAVGSRRFAPAARLTPEKSARLRRAWL